VADLGHASHDTIETIAAAVVVVGGAIFTALSYRTRRARRATAGFGSSTPASAGGLPGLGVDPSLTRIMAGLSAGAAVIHLAAAPSHYVELGDLASGFLISAAFQAWWAIRARSRLTGRIVVLGVVANVAILAAWAWTRTVGLPIGEFAGHAEPIGFPDAASAAFEILLVALLVVRGTGLDRPVGRRRLGAIASIAVVPVVGLVVVLTSLATFAIASGLDHGPPASSSSTTGHSH
jgi:hypothetical protein